MAMRIFLLQLSSIVSIIAAAVLAFNGIGGWGWFLFYAFMSGAPQGWNAISKSKDSDKEADET